MKISTIKDLAILGFIAYIVYKIIGDWFPALKEKIEALGRNIRNTWEQRNISGGDGDLDREVDPKTQKGEEMQEVAKESESFWVRIFGGKHNYNED